MENQENTRSAPKNFLQEAYEVTGNEKAIRNLANEAEVAGNYEHATLITEDVLHEHGEKRNELRRKWSEKEAASGNFKLAAEILEPTVSSGDEMAPIAQRAEDAGDLKAAHFIYYRLIHDSKKEKETLAKWAEQKAAGGDFLNAANMFEGAGMPEKILETAKNAELANDYGSAVRIYEDIMNDHGEKRNELRRQWSKKEEEAGNYLNAAIILIKLKDRAGVKNIAEKALLAGDKKSALSILEEVLHDYGPETSALAEELLATPPTP